MLLSRWLSRLGQRGRFVRRTSTSTHRFFPTLEALEARDVPSASLSSPFAAPMPPVFGLLSQLNATPFGAGADGLQPLSFQKAEAIASTSARPCVFVQNGQSIQAAINAAQAGTTIFIEPGTYSGSLSVDTAGITLVGLFGADGSHVVLVNSGVPGDGVDVNAKGAGFAMRYVEIRGFTGDGVSLNNVNGFNLSHLLLVDNTGSGIATAYSKNGVVQYTEESGQRAAGLDFENSSGIEVNFNRTDGNVAGIQLVNTGNTMVMGNVVSDNTAGIVVAQLPGAVSSGDMIAENYVDANNLPNFAAPGTPEAALTQGTGILLLGAHNTLAVGNVVMDNQTMGIGILSSPALFEAYGATAQSLVGGVAAASNNIVAFNWAIDNGFHSMSPALPPGADLVWDGLGSGNHESGNWTL